MFMKLGIASVLFIIEFFILIIRFGLEYLLKEDNNNLFIYIKYCYDD